MNIDPRPEARADLFASTQEALPRLDQALLKVQGRRFAQDLFYRIYHQSNRVNFCSFETAEIVQGLRALAPGRRPWFLAIVADAAGRSFTKEANARWLEETRSVIEAFLHARVFLELVVQAGRAGQQPRHTLPSGWAALLCLNQPR